MKKNKGLGAFFHSLGEYSRFNKLPKEWRSIVFYSESGQDWHHLEPYITYLTDVKDRKVTYVTSDRNDPAFTQENKNLEAVFIQDGFWMITWFRMHRADVVVLTMCDLHSMHVKRSDYPVHYLYLFHAMGSTHMVDYEDSYDYYDSIFCVGPHQMNEIRAREKQAGLPEKLLVKHGYARVEKLNREYREYQFEKGDTTNVLVAPTWGPNSILNVCGKELVGVLLDAGFRVTLRPHYQTAKLTPEVIADIRKAYDGNELFSYEGRMGDQTSLFESDILICDWSSTSIEYALGLEKPVLYVDVPRRVRNENYESLGCEPMEVTIREKVGKIVSPESLADAPQMIRELVADPAQFADKIKATRDEILFNFGSSVPVGGDEIVRIADQQKGVGSSGEIVS